MTTVDLLLTLGGKLADVLVTSLNRRGSKEDKKELSDLVQEYTQVKKTYLEIQTLLHSYNQAIAQSFVKGSIQEIFHLCSYQAYLTAEQNYLAFQQHQVTHTILDSFKLLSVSVTTRTEKRDDLGWTGTTHYQEAEAYTREKWITFYRNGAQTKDDVINHYFLVREHESWKVDSSLVFVKAPNT